MSDTVVYREDARSYRSLGWSVITIPAAFGLDWLVSGRHGALVHLPGWLVFGGLLIGAHWLLLHAVRSTHSLLVTPEELAVGDETVARADIAGVALGRGPDPDVVTLGWPNGFPRKAAAVTVRLADGRDILVPTRFPDLLSDALQVGALEPERPPDVRVAGAADLDQVPGIDERAEVIFRVAGYPLPALPFDHDALRAAALVLVIDEPPVGFAWVDEVDGAAHLHELAVLPSAMRRGHGGRLLEAACEWAVRRGYAALTLTTFAEVPWNGPFYAARGFVEIEPQTPQLQAIRAHERAVGLDAVARRVVMRRVLSPANRA